MPVTLDELILRLEARGTTEAGAQVEKVAGQVERAGKRVRGTADDFKAPGMAMVDGTMAIEGWVTAVLGAMAAIGAASGVNLAARYQTMQKGFEAITGSATEAAKVMNEMRRIGEQTRFPTEQVVGFAQRLMSTGSSAARVGAEITAMADAITGSGKGVAEFAELTRMMSGLRFRRRLEVEEVEALGGVGINIPKVVGAATGQNLTTAQALQKLQSMTGEQAFNLLVRGMDKAFHGAAAAQAMDTLEGVAENTMEAFANIMEPTGQMLLPMLQQLGGAIKWVADQVKDLNTALGGQLGLYAALLLVIKAKGLLVAAIRAAWTWTMNLTAALERYAGAAAAAASATAANTAAQAAEGATSAASAAVQGAAAARTFTGNTAARMLPYGGSLRLAMTGGGFAGLMRLIGAWGKGVLSGPIGAIGGALSWLKGSFGAIKGGLSIPGVLGAAGKILKNPFGAGIIGVGAELLGNWMGGKTGHVVSSVGQGVAWGALLGSIIPGLGTAAGAIIGGVVGLGKGIWDITHPEKDAKSNDAQAQIAANTKATAEALQDIRGQWMGGGPRMQNAASSIEVEIALARMYRTGLA